MNPPLALRSVLPLLVLASAASAQAPGTVHSERLFSGGPLLPLDDGDQFGRAVCVLGDVDGDGVQDLAVGAHADDDGGLQGSTSDVGAAYVLFLGPNGSLRSATKISATAGGLTAQLDDRDYFGKAVAGLGDLDGDGIPDLAVGSPRDDDGGSARGAVFLLFLNRDGTVREHGKISATVGGLDGALKDLDEFGASVANLGDVDADGTVDLLVGARLDDTGGTNRGAAYVLFLRPDGTVRAWQKLASDTGGLVGPLLNNDSFGQALTGIGDLDGDGVPDAVVGATKDDEGGLRRGAVYVLFLARDGTVRAEQKIASESGGLVGPLMDRDEFGNGVTGLGDLDGDGVTDIAVGAIFDAEAGIARGAVWILFLNPDGTVKAEQKLNELQGGFGGTLTDGGEFGESVYTLGDLDGDGVAELGVGERFRGQAGSGRGGVWVLFLNGVASDPPRVSFEATVAGGVAPLPVGYLDTTVGDVRRWTWDFGDGTRSYERDPVHVYAAPGRYDVTLTVETPVGTTTTTRLGAIAVTRPGRRDVRASGSPTLLQGAGGLR